MSQLALTLTLSDSLRREASPRQCPPQEALIINNECKMVRGQDRGLRNMIRPNVLADLPLRPPLEDGSLTFRSPSPTCPDLALMS